MTVRTLIMSTHEGWVAAVVLAFVVVTLGSGTGFSTLDAFALGVLPEETTIYEKEWRAERYLKIQRERARKIGQGEKCVCAAQTPTLEAFKAFSLAFT